jgi:hypothetical protein
MDIVVYLNNGQIRNFAQPDPAVVNGLLTDFQAGRLFSVPSMIFGSGASCALINAAAISRIDVIADQPLNVQSTIRDEARVIEDEQAFNLRAKAAAKAFADGVAPGEAYQGYLSFQLAGGFVVRIELMRQLQHQAQFFTNLHRLFGSSVICFPHPRGGVLAINVTNIVSVDAAPGFTEYPKGTFLVDER